LVRNLALARSWPDVTDAVNTALRPGRCRFTKDRLVTAIEQLLAEALAESELLGETGKSARGGLERAGLQ
jgi:hypothetical protein